MWKTRPVVYAYAACYNKHKLNKGLLVQKGFTIVELLVVIVVIGILAAIGIVSYNGIQDQAQDTSVQTDLEHIAGQLEGYRVQQTNTAQQFPNTATLLETLGIKVAKGAYDTTVSHNLVYCLTTTGTDAYQSFALVAQSKSGNIYMMTEDGFRSHSLTTSNLNATLCSTTLSKTLISNGWTSASGAWRAWVGNS
jgi:prepilin-type N-terminal cleavage/methylation domain-containing protein